MSHLREKSEIKISRTKNQEPRTKFQSGASYGIWSLVLGIFQGSCRCLVGEHEGLILVYAPGWNRGVGVDETHERLSLILPGHEPEDAPRTIDDGIGQRHPPPALVNSGHCDISIGDVKDRISGNQTGGVAVRSEAQVNDIEDGWGAGDLQESSRVG